MNNLGLCLGCMEKIGKASLCPYCGYTNNYGPQLTHHLVPGTILQGKYLIGKVLGQGGFGITYLAWDTVLDLKIAVKEFFPMGLVSRSYGNATVDSYGTFYQEQFTFGKTRFLSEAKTLARFSEHPNIVTVRDFFEGNNTAYMVMNYIEGRTLEQHLNIVGGAVPYDIMMNIMMPVMDALREVHKAGVMHRDVSPDNIYIRKDGRVILIDFGAARQELQNNSRSVSVILKKGYSPEEQYRSKSEQGPWTDVYAAAATIYRGITGEMPPESIDRLDKDSLLYPSEIGIEIPSEQEKVLLKALALKAGNRYQSIEDFQKAVAKNNPNNHAKGKAPKNDWQEGKNRAGSMYHKYANENFKKNHSNSSEGYRVYEKGDKHCRPEKDGLNKGALVQAQTKSNKYKMVALISAALMIMLLLVFISFYVLNDFLLGNDLSSAQTVPLAESEERSLAVRSINVPSDHRTVMEAIASANNGDEIIVQPGTYYENIDFSGKSVILSSTDPDDPDIVGRTIIEGNGSGSVISFRNGEGEKTVLNGFTITSGSGIVISGGSNPVIKNCVIEDNYAEFGGGIAIFDSSPTITGNTIRYNTGLLGGGLFIEESSPLIQDNIIDSNKAEMGAGIVIISKSFPRLIGNTISNNSADRLGGGIVIAVDSAPEIRKNIIRENTAERNGGGILIEESAPIISDNTITLNTATNGGGIFVVNSLSSNLIISNNTIRSNRSLIAGAGLYSEGSMFVLESNIFTYNESNYLGGGFAAYNTTLNLRNNQFAINQAFGSEGGGAGWISADSNLNVNIPDDNTYSDNRPNNISRE